MKNVIKKIFKNTDFYGFSILGDTYPLDPPPKKKEEIVELFNSIIQKSLLNKQD